jgi:hypothetical protein
LMRAACCLGGLFLRHRRSHTHTRQRASCAAAHTRVAAERRLLLAQNLRAIGMANKRAVPPPRRPGAHQSEQNLRAGGAAPRRAVRPPAASPPARRGSHRMAQSLCRRHKDLGRGTQFFSWFMCNLVLSLFSLGCQGAKIAHACRPPALRACALHSVHKIRGALAQTG